MVEVAQEGRVGQRRLHTQQREPARGPRRPLRGAQLVKRGVDVASKHSGETGLSEQPCEIRRAFLGGKCEGAVNRQKLLGCPPPALRGRGEQDTTEEA